MNMNELTPAVICIVLRARSLAAIRCSAFPHFISLTYPHAPRFGPPDPPSRGAEINFVSHLHIEKESSGSFSGHTYSNAGGHVCAFAARSLTQTFAERICPSLLKHMQFSISHASDAVRRMS